MSIPPGGRHNRRNDRRPPGPTRHAMAVHLNTNKRMEVRCTCGQVFGGKRFEDMEVVTLNDILMMVRVHSQQYNTR